MKVQASIIVAFIFALLIALFAVVNVEAVPVDYVWGQSNVPLILVIIGSALFGGLAVGLFGIVRQYKLTRRIRALEKQTAGAHSFEGDSVPVPVKPELTDTLNRSDEYKERLP
ncbi:LapA family protein [Paenibacillus methanolicus]|uniref:Putative integral membrane protein n=1 Tax=Paenibacillus methanolicus TaxID=582686 RepID=A0A5S5CJD6_9BACL|nr:lipopolysaccharide assembly protein LapA domain-containing protein [Paenibacillus methanolicus]TYP79802.1 putative integral membrane protein [Paenibacillus methanolicus]